MLDEKDLQAIHTMMEQQKKEILKESMANMQVIIENTFAPQFKLLFEKLDSMGSKMIPQEKSIQETLQKIEEVKESVNSSSSKIEELKKAQ